MQRRPGRRSPRWLGPVCAAAAISVPAFAVPLAAHAAPATAAAAGTATTKPGKSAVSALQRRLFSTFERRADPPKGRHALDSFHGFPKAWGTLDTRQARRVRDPRVGFARKKPWFLVPGDGAVGLILPGGGVAGTTTQACHGGVWLMVPHAAGAVEVTTATPVTFYGIATDDITSVVASGGTGGGGSAGPVEAVPRNNVWYLDAPDGLADLTFLRDGVAHVVNHVLELQPPLPPRCDPGSGDAPKAKD